MDEQMIKDAYEEIAATAVSPERVRARIAARARAHRQRRLVLAGAGAATVAVALAVPVSLYRRPAGVGLPAGTAEPREKSLLFTPGWLPAGVGERHRAIKFDTRTGRTLGGSRSWYPDGSPYSETAPEGSVTFLIDERMDPETSQPVMIGEVRGAMWVTDAAWVQWQPVGGPTMTVSAYGTGDDAGIAVRVARSVAPTTETTRITLWLPGLPADFAGTGWFESFATATGGFQSMAYDSDTKRSAQFTLQTSPPESGVPFESVERDGIMVYLPRGEDVALTNNQARAVLEQVECLPPDLSWEGGR